MGISEKQINQWLQRNEQLVVTPVTQDSRQRESSWTLNIEPMAKPRMVRSDAWRKRPAVQRYWQWKDRLTAEAANQRLQLPSAFLVIFFIAMPASWSKRKKAQYAGREHTQTPDTDNLLKALKDALLEDDSTIFYDAPLKVWSYRPAIYIEAVQPQPLLDYAALIAGRYRL